MCKTLARAELEGGMANEGAGYIVRAIVCEINSYDEKINKLCHC